MSEVKEVKYDKKVVIANAIYHLDTLLAKFILLILAATMSEWPFWFKAGLCITLIVTLFNNNLNGTIMGFLTILGLQNDILGIFSNGLSYNVRLGFIVLSLIWLICNRIIAIYGFAKTDKITDDLMKDKKWSKGYYDQWAEKK